MTILAKICGINSFIAAQTAIDSGADLLGFIYFSKSPRHLPIDNAQALMQQARQHASARANKVNLVSVVVNPDNELLDHIARELKPDFIQLHGHETPERVADIRARLNVSLIKAISVSSKDDVATARVYEPLVAHMLFDAKPPKDATLPGGVGAKFDWTLMEGHKGLAPWFLAGGLDPWNVADAIATAKAPMVDVSSGVERGPGLKDPSLITQFLKNAKGS
ncbi:phosphoribosylanthranilate isomerase [Asticcacaulis machinosus]|uniref:N-(5'-phosphoribosyl)anthranilate isomerase n=1 Tax=Asticcacaulis machinosus TaxID=2984211 RepID=A0ABT5HLJ0_9CAUL|nr:phosphoribosylanthranilate isomerase [Asticcacaulis machinosus]MDC7676868.1 phosphoribosylanthranilate isomerase [Asticcacaulis machinosus]